MESSGSNVVTGHALPDASRIPFPSHTTALAGARPPFTVGLVTRAWLLANAVAEVHMNDRESAYASHMFVQHVTQTATDINYAYTRPSVVFRPTLSVDGNQWCALLGADLQSGVAGFGDTPDAAMADFDKSWSTPLRNSPSGIALAARVKP